MCVAEFISFHLNHPKKEKKHKQKKSNFAMSHEQGDDDQQGGDFIDEQEAVLVQCVAGLGSDSPAPVFLNFFLVITTPPLPLFVTRRAKPTRSRGR